MIVSAMVLALMAGGVEMQASSSAQVAKASEARVVYVCDSTEATRVAFERQYGEMKFVTAREAAKKGDTWSAPRCMTNAEHKRLMQMRLQAGLPATYASR